VGGASHGALVKRVGDFTGWDGRVIPMRSEAAFAGICVVFHNPEFGETSFYKTKIVGPANNVCR